MGTRLRVLALALAGFALAVSAVAACPGAAPADLYDLLVGQPALSEEFDAHIDAVRLTIDGKEEVTRELVAGRLILAEAADRFERLDARRFESLGLPRPSRGRASVPPRHRVGQQADVGPGPGAPGAGASHLKVP
jgi:hypothetical protein